MTDTTQPLFGRLLSESVSYSLIEVGQQLAAMIAVPVLFFYVTPAGFGVITTAMVWSQLVMTVTVLALDFALLRLYFKWSEGTRRRAYRRVAAGTSVWAVVIVLTFAALARPIWGNGEIALDMWLGAATGGALGIRAVPLAVLRVTSRVRLYGAVMLGGSCLQSAVQVVLVIGGWGVRGYLVGSALAAAITMVFALICVARLPRSTSRLADESPSEFPSDLVPYAARIFPSTLFQRLVAVADRVTLYFWGSFDGLGVYGAASRFTIPLKFLSGGFKTALAPALSRAEHENPMALQPLLAQAGMVLLLAMLTSAAGLSAASWLLQFTPWVDQMRLLQQLLALLLVAQVISGLAFLGHLRLLYSADPARANWIAVANAVSLGLALVILVPRHGALGAALAEVVSAMVSVIVAAFQVMRLGAEPDVWKRWVVAVASFGPTFLALWMLDPGLQGAVLFPMFVAYSVALVRLGRRMIGRQLSAVAQS